GERLGETSAATLLGTGATATPITNTMTGAIFAFVSGLTGTFTACNVAGFCAVAPLASHRRSIEGTLRPLAWLAAGAATVAGIYGVPALSWALTSHSCRLTWQGGFQCA